MDHPSRVRQLDLLRGTAVLLMVVGHTIDALLAEPLRHSQTFLHYQLFRSLTAPLFLFTSGFVLMVAAERHWTAFLRFGAHTRARLRRILLLFTLGYALHLPFFSLRKVLTAATERELAAFWQVDILQCIAVSLVLLQLTLFISRRPSVHSVVVWSIGVAAILVAPILWSVDLSPWVPRSLTPYLNDKQQTLFPLFPYLGFLFVGAGVAHTFIAAQKTNNSQAWLRRLALVGLAAVVLGLAATWSPIELYPPHDHWKINPASNAIRLGLVLLLLRGLFAWRQPSAQLSTAATLLGRSSLFVYVLHLVILYGSPVNPGLRWSINGGLQLPTVLVVSLGMVLLMLGAAAGLHHCEGFHPPTWRRLQFGLAGVTAGLFAVLPH